MSDLHLEKVDETHMRIHCDESITMELKDRFSFLVPGYEWMPAYRNGLWDGYIKLYDARNRKFYLGLYDDIIQFAQENDYTVTQSFDLDRKNYTTGSIQAYANTLDLHVGGNPIQLKDYQAEAVKFAINNKRALLLSPTSSGKSLIIYMLCRILAKKKILVIVPSINLVDQMTGDFADYSSEEEGWITPEKVHKIYAGEAHNTNKPITISTWQSIYKKHKKWFQQFDVVIGDEIHGAKANSLKGIFEKATEAQYKIGLTGTLDGTETNEMVIRGLTGPIKVVTTTYDLMMNGDIAPHKILATILKYRDEERKYVEGISYHDETDFIISHDRRNHFISKLALGQNKNTIILFRYVKKHGHVLYDLITELNDDPNRPVFFVDGSKGREDRERIRVIAERETNAIIVASVGTMSTGVNIKNLHNLILAAGGKGRIKVLQSIGRILRMHGDKEVARVYDIIDDLRTKKNMNHYFRHYLFRLTYYKENKMPRKVKEFDL